MMEIETVLSGGALAPQRAYPTDAGADLKSIENWDLMPGHEKLFDTGIAIAIPEGFVGLIFSRSGNAKNGIKLANSVAVIDSDYRGNLKILLENTSSDYTFIVKRGVTKIAQLVIVPIMLPVYKQVDTLDDTVRGIGGFGSTGA
jgi:dUTP pyrophosphatase